MVKTEEKEGTITETQIQDVARKIEEGIKAKEASGKKDKSLKVDTRSGLFVRITRNPDQEKFYLSIGPRGGHPVYNKVIFDSSEKLKEFLNALKMFVKEREDVILAIDYLNQKSNRKDSDVI